MPFLTNPFLGLAWDTGVNFLCGLSRLGFVALYFSSFSDWRGSVCRLMLLGHVSVLVTDVWWVGGETELIPSQSGSTGSSCVFDCLCFLNVKEGETWKLRWNRLGKQWGWGSLVSAECNLLHSVLDGSKHLSWLQHISCLHLTDWVLLPLFGPYSGCGCWSSTSDLKFIF